MISFKKILTLSFLTALFSFHAHAQGRFTEMRYSPTQTVFTLNAPTPITNRNSEVDGVTGASLQASAAAPASSSAGSAQVLLRLYDNGEDGQPIKTVKMKKDGENHWKATVKGDWMGKFYTFDTGHGETPGVFAKAVGVNGHRAAIIDMKATNPAGWSHDTVAASSPAIIYELHHRDFSIDPSSGLRHRGKFLALTEPKAIDYLKDLGVTDVHILPSFDFASIDETNLAKPQYNWGYDPLNYNVPEGSYSTNPYDPSVRISEFKQMVQALHKAGIRVILDVVYNHTFDLDHSNFQLTWPGYYYRFGKDGKPSNGSGCGNETASEQPLMREFMLESVKYWVNEYHIDGFRFDLMGVHDITTMNAIRKELNAINPNLLMYGEGWSAGQCALPKAQLATKDHISLMPGIAAFSDELRDALRGPFDDDTKGAFLMGIAGEEESIKAGIAGMIAHPQVDYTKVNYTHEPWATEPTQMIAYVSCHDDMCLVDRLKTELGSKALSSTIIRLDKLAQTAVFTSQGIPFMLSGEEMLRDKKGVHNSFNSPDSVNHLDWNNLTRYPAVYAYYKGLIALKKHHPAFRLGRAEAVRQHLEFLPTQDCLVAFRLKDHAGGDAWDNIIVALNGNREPKTITVPEGNYTVVCADGTIDESGMAFRQPGQASTFTVAPQSALIIHQ